MIAIIDYNTGNVGSIKNMLKKLGEREVIVTGKSEDLIYADKYILPGVGAFDYGMNSLDASGLIPELENQVLGNKKPILGICLGMQLLGRRSEEGERKGLGWIAFDTVRFNLEKQYKIPHMGWNYVSVVKEDEPIVKGMTQNKERFYFVHSYHAVCDYSDNILMTCNYGYDFTASVISNNIIGVQFHPEKSHRFGMQLFKNFMEL